MELEQEEPLSEDDESEGDEDFDGGDKPRRRASTGAHDGGRGRGPRMSLSPNAGRPRGPRLHVRTLLEYQPRVETNFPFLEIDF